MREAVGGAFSLEIVFMFILLVNGYIAYSVNYARAFRTKNGIINIIEENEGYTSNTNDKIHNYVGQMGYGIPKNQIDQAGSSGKYDSCSATDGYCYVCKADSSVDSESDLYKGVTYTVTTFVSLDIPVIRNILPLGEWLAVSGESKSIYAKDGCPKG